MQQLKLPKEGCKLQQKQDHHVPTDFLFLQRDKGTMKNLQPLFLITCIYIMIQKTILQNPSRHIHKISEVKLYVIQIALSQCGKYVNIAKNFHFTLLI